MAARASSRSTLREGRALGSEESKWSECGLRFGQRREAEQTLLRMTRINFDFTL
jgi:hypothetical protein